MQAVSTFAAILCRAHFIILIAANTSDVAWCTVRGGTWNNNLGCVGGTPDTEDKVAQRARRHSEVFLGSTCSLHSNLPLLPFLRAVHRSPGGRAYRSATRQRLAHQLRQSNWF